MELHFTKMHGLGNDFVVIDAISQDIDLTEAFVQALGDRHFGVGFDQLLIVQAPTQKNMDFKYRIFNASGEEVEQCGNGARCFARFVIEQKLTNKKIINVETCNANITLELTQDNLVKVDMGQPVFEPKDIPFLANQKQSSYRIDAGEFGQLEINAISMGNPHCVLLVDDVQTAPVATLGALLESHPDFPKKVNVGFLQIIDSKHAKLRVYERGVGETQACGTGACAAMVAGVMRGKLDNEATLTLLGGDLTIRWQAEQSVIMIGDAVRVFEGKMKWPITTQ
ncbi:diaminopimelate epimerase [Marinicellulosiphila megalodicopiae]|uniref:diaminopimelate epimerase n=1 Tax=Marinicellulosiphila megalodicopiae TaxID=2724896 RepID=UPI003BB2002D